MADLVPLHPLALPRQGAFKKVAAEVEACGRELAGLLRKRLLAAPDQAAECIQMIAKLGEPTESLQVRRDGSGPRGRGGREAAPGRWPRAGWSRTSMRHAVRAAAPCLRCRTRPPL